jgi:sugar lactone lactonase YvrE
MRRIGMAIVAVACLVAVAAPAAAGAKTSFPSEIDLPETFFPEGIAIGRGSTFYVGSLADGSIYKGDLRTGEGEVFTQPTGGFPFSTVGLDVDWRNRVWAAGAAAGTGRVYDGDTGELLETYQFTPLLESLINDVIVTPKAAWFTDSGTQNCDPNIPGLCFPGQVRLFKVALGKGGTLPDPGAPGAVQQIDVNLPDVYFSNLNGIETMPGSQELILVHNSIGSLFRFDPETGAVSPLYGPPDDPEFMGADGMSRRGNMLYVVENEAKRIAVLKLGKSAGAKLLGVLPVPNADTPTTSALFGSAVYTVDARFSTLGQGPYKVFRVELQSMIEVE